MLMHNLEKAIEDLERLMELTSMDIEDIKRARHDAMFERIALKERTLESFEKRKARIDGEIAALQKAYPESDLSELLEDETRRRLGELRDTLEKLQSLNRYYARFVITVGEFYNSLYEEMFPIEKDGYTGKSPKVASLIELRV